jgi:hypothetical protein
LEAFNSGSLLTKTFEPYANKGTYHAITLTESGGNIHGHASSK